MSRTQIGIESSGREIILSTSVELSLTREKFPVSTGWISILQLRVESFLSRTEFSDWELRISARQVVLNLPTGS